MSDPFKYAEPRHMTEGPPAPLPSQPDDSLDEMIEAFQNTDEYRDTALAWCEEQYNLDENWSERMSNHLWERDK